MAWALSKSVKQPLTSSFSSVSVRLPPRFFLRRLTDTYDLGNLPKTTVDFTKAPAVIPHGWQTTVASHALVPPTKRHWIPAQKTAGMALLGLSAGLREIARIKGDARGVVGRMK